MEPLNTYVRISDIAKSMTWPVPSETVIMMNHMANTGTTKKGRLEKVAKIFTQAAPGPFYLISWRSV